MTPDDPSPAPGPAVIETPPMLRPAAGAVGDLPVHTGPQRVLGVRAGGRKGDFYFVASSNLWATRRYARRFPLDQQGWEAAWRVFATEDPAGALAYVEKRAAAAAGDTAANASRRPPDEPEIRPIPTGWSYILGGFALMVMGIVLVHAGASWHNSGLIVFAFVTVSFGLLVALVGVVAEGIRVSSHSRENEQRP